jgi:tetratricopeptide (TPR) repeat protein
MNVGLMIKKMSDQGESESDRIIREERDRLLASLLFQRSPVVSRLLQFLVEHRLKSGRAAPKAYVIATEALGRSADFDPAVDSYPRVMVGRLRHLLDRYYADNVWTHRLRIPQGSYEIIIQQMEASPAVVQAELVGNSDSGSDVVSRDMSKAGEATPQGILKTRRHLLARSRILFIVLFLLATLVMAGWWLNESSQKNDADTLVPVPSVEISQPAGGQSNISLAIARSLEAKLRDGLRRFDVIELQSGRKTKVGKSKLLPDYRLDSSLVRTANGPVHVTLVLNRVADERTIWSQQIEIKHDDVTVFSDIEPAISKIAGDFGIIVQDQLEREPENYAPGFPCFAHYGRARQVRTPEMLAAATTCLRASLQRNPNDPVLLNALSLIRFADWPPRRMEPSGKAAFAEAQNLAQHANEVGYNRSAGLFALARAKFYAGDCEQGRTFGNLAFERNPLDADMVGSLGLFELACGDLERGESLLRRSLWLDNTHGGVPAVALAFMLSQRGKNGEGLAILNRLPAPANGTPQYQLVKAIIYARIGQMAEAQRLWANVSAQTGQSPDATPETVLQQFIIAPTLIKRTAAALRQTGLAGGAPPS